MATPSSSSLRLKSSSTSNSSEFIHFKATMRLPIPPVFSSNGQHLLDGPNGDGGMDGVREVLAGWVMRYLPPLHAVVLSFNPDPTFLHPSALFDSTASPFDTDHSYIKNPLASPPPTSKAGETITGNAEEKERIENGELIRLKTLPMVDGSGFTLADVEWQGLGWKPTVGMKLVGTPTLSTSSHVSLLLHNLFNASIPSSHIPSNTWEFDPSYPVPSSVLERRTKGVSVSATGDIQDLQAKARKSKREALGIEGDDAEESEASDEEKEEEGIEEEEDEEMYAEEGWWVHKTTREPLGGKQGKISFTLVALSTSNSLLSCTGSLLSDPFTPSALASLHNPSASESSSNLALLQAQAVRSGHAQLREEDESEDGDSDESSQSDGEGEEESEVDRDDDDGVGTGVPRHEGVPSKFEDPTKSDSDSDSSSSSEDSDSSRSPSPPPEPKKKSSSKKKETKVGKVDVDTVKKGKTKSEKKGKTKSEKKGKPPVVEEEVVAPVKSGKKEKKRKGDETVVGKSKKLKKA